MFATYFTNMNFHGRLLPFILTTTCLIIVCSTSNAQTDRTVGNWNALFLKGKIAEKWSLIGEGTIRSSNYNLKYDYFEVKTAVSYNFTGNLIGLIGTGLFNTDKPGELFQTPSLQKELRTWLELSFRQVFGRFNFDHRVRLEQRFIPGDYKNRLKYRLALVLPVNKAELIQGCLYLSLNDELWMPQYGVVVEKNRLYAGLGYKLNRNMALQVGCVHDNDYKPDYKTAKNYLQFTLFYDFTKLIQRKRS